MLDNLIAKYRDLQAKHENNEGGFTLIELLVVVVIIGILIAIAIPLYLNYQKGAADKSAASDVRGAVSAVNQCAADNTASAFPTTAEAVGSGTKDTDIKFTCGGQTAAQTATVSEGTTLTYTLVTGGKSFTIKGVNSGGEKTYTYDSATGRTRS